MCPDNVNPAEYVLDAIGAGLTPPVGDRDWAELWRKSPEFQDTIIEIERIKTETAKKQKGEDRASSRFVTPFSYQLRVVTKRSFVGLCRSPNYVYTRVLRSCNDLVDLVPFVFAIGPQREGSAVQTFLDVSVCIGGGPTLLHQDANLRPPARCWVCIIPTIIQVQLVPLWIFNRRE